MVSRKWLRQMKWRPLLLLALLGYFAASCAIPHKSSHKNIQPKTLDSNAEVYARALRGFEQVDLYKPIASSEDLPVKLALFVPPRSAFRSGRARPNPIRRGRVHYDCRTSFNRRSSLEGA